MHGYRKKYEGDLKGHDNFDEGNQSCLVTKMYRSDLNENGNFRSGKLIIHGYRILHGGDLNINEHYKRRIYYLIFCDGRIIVFFCDIISP